MAYIDDIKKQYENAYNSQVGELERQKQKAFEDATNRENQTKLQYDELMKQYQSNKTDVGNKYKGLQSALDTQKSDGEKKFYSDRNQVSTQNAKNTQQTRDYMAKNNLLQSGESVDAMLRSNTDLANGIGNIASNEATMNRDIGNQRNVYNQEEQSNYQKIDGMIGASEREKTQKLNELLAYRNSAMEDYNSKKNSYYEQMQSNQIKDINAYNEQLRQEQLQAQRIAEQRAYEQRQQEAQRAYEAQQAAAARSYSQQQAAAKPPSIQDEKDSFLTQFKNAARNNDPSAFATLNDDKEEIINRYGKDYYGLLKDFYYSNSSQRITSNNSGKNRIN